MDKGQFSLSSLAAQLTFVATLQGPVVPVAGYGGWDKVARPRRRSLTEWNGRDPLTLEVDFLLNNDDGKGVEVEAACKVIERMAGVGGGDAEPPHDLILQSEPEPLIPWNFRRNANLRWFVEGLSWDKENTLANDAGNRTRALGTITVTQFVEDVHLSAVKAHNERTGRVRTKPYRVKRGDTLAKIAASRLHNSKRWREIAKLNGIRDPKHLKVNQLIRIPAK